MSCQNYTLLKKENFLIPKIENLKTYFMLNKNKSIEFFLKKSINIFFVSYCLKYLHFFIKIIIFKNLMIVGIWMFNKKLKFKKGFTSTEMILFLGVPAIIGFITFLNMLKQNLKQLMIIFLIIMKL